jgi:hypothetical protein
MSGFTPQLLLTRFSEFATLIKLKIVSSRLGSLRGLPKRTKKSGMKIDSIRQDARGIALPSLMGALIDSL